MDGVILTPLRQVYHPKGDILHAMKKSDIGFSGFGEAYFSTIGQGKIKGWKKHTQMILNLVVCMGEIKFAIYNENQNKFFSIILSHKNYQRLTVGCGLWMAFQGIGKDNMLLNLASIEHNPNEAVTKELQGINFNGWNA